MKRWLFALGTALFAAMLVLPFFSAAPQSVQPPARAPELPPEPVVPFRWSATGEQTEIPMEEYIVGVVAAEMGPEFPEQALAAQAILARTYTLRRVELGDVATDNVGTFQAYEPKRITERARQAVAATRGQVIVHGTELVDAVYHACSGGRTAGAAEGMQAPDRPYLRPVADPPCPRDETWTARVKPGEVATVAGVKQPLWKVQVGRRGDSGRALTVMINDREVSAFAFRSGLGGTRIKSTYLTDLRLEEGKVVIRGRGFGHGVGLSQWGAVALASKGFTAEEIIHHYFVNVQIERRW